MTPPVGNRLLRQMLGGLALALLIAAPLLWASSARRDAALEQQLSLHAQAHDALCLSLAEFPPGVVDIFAASPSAQSRVKAASEEHIRSCLNNQQYYAEHAECGVQLQLEQDFLDRCQASSQLPAAVLMQHVFARLPDLGFRPLMGGTPVTTGHTDATELSHGSWRSADGSIVVQGVTVVNRPAREAAMQIFMECQFDRAQ